MAKKKWERHETYCKEIEFYKFHSHGKVKSMIKIPTRTNPETGYGEAMCIGIPKAKALIDVKTIVALKKFVADHPDELTVISAEAHLKGDKKDG